MLAIEEQAIEQELPRQELQDAAKLERSKQLEIELLTEKARIKQLEETLQNLMDQQHINQNRNEIDVGTSCEDNGNADCGSTKTMDHVAFDGLRNLLDVATRECAQKQKNLDAVTQDLGLQVEMNQQLRANCSALQMEIETLKFKLFEAQQTMARMTAEYEATSKQLEQCSMAYREKDRQFDNFQQEHQYFQRILHLATLQNVDLFSLNKDQYWQRDSEAIMCSYNDCQVHFGLFNRRHHCRRCGNIFCSYHSGQKLRMNLITRNVDPTGFVGRVCDGCYASQDVFRMDTDN